MNQNKEVTVSVRMDEGQLQEIDKMRGKKTRSQFIRDMVDQPRKQDSSRDDMREREIEREEREREERNQNREEQLRKEARNRRETDNPQPILDTSSHQIDQGELSRYGEMVNSLESGYTKNQLARSLASITYRNIDLTQQLQKSEGVLKILAQNQPNLDINQPIQAISSSPQAPYGPQQQPQQKEESTSSMKEMIDIVKPILMLRAISGNQAPAPQPLITPELVAALRPKKKCVTITDGKTGAIHEIPVDIYFQMQNQGITVADIDAIIQKYQQKGD